ncbi:MAG: hypothetical protein ACYTBJ_15300 [Planctomycetota bacterium]|jgi:hypothetical protein
MKTQKLTAIFAAIITCGAIVGQGAEKQSTSAISDTRRASCLVKVAYDRAVFPLAVYIEYPGDTVESLVRSSGVAGKAAREVLGQALEQDFLGIEFVSGPLPELRSERLTGARPGLRERALLERAGGRQGLYRKGMDGAREQRVADLMSKATALGQARRYKEALGQLEMVLAMEPENAAARTLKEKVESEIRFQERSQPRPEKEGRKNDEPYEEEDHSLEYYERAIQSRPVPGYGGYGGGGYGGYGGYGRGGYGGYGGGGYGGYGGYGRGGYGGGYGRGGYGGYGGGGYGGYGARVHSGRSGYGTSQLQAPPRTRAAGSTCRAVESLLFQLHVELPANVKPAAEEFMNALINNLRETLMATSDAYHQKVDHEYAAAEGHRDWARERLSEALGLTSHTDADLELMGQVKREVDLSAWNTEMPFGEAIEQLKRSVEPPLPVVVLWHDLGENAGIDQAITINIDAAPRIQVGKALELLVKSLSSASGVELGYEIDKAVIMIATADRLPSAEQRLSLMTQTDAPVEMLLERKNDLFREKQELEMEIARYEAQQSAIEEQIGRIDAAVADKVKSDPTAFEIQRLIDMNARELERARQALESGKRVTGIDEVAEKLARAKIELAQRREELSNSAGGNRLSDLNMNLTDVMIDLAVSRAEFEVVSRQLVEAEEQLKTASAVDPEISQIRLAQEELEIAERQVTELRIRRVNLWKPTVTVLGGI